MIKLGFLIEADNFVFDMNLPRNLSYIYVLRLYYYYFETLFIITLLIFFLNCILMVMWAPQQ